MQILGVTGRWVKLQIRPDITVMVDWVLKIKYLSKKSNICLSTMQMLPSLKTESGRYSADSESDFQSQSCKAHPAEEFVSVLSLTNDLNL